MDRRREQCPAPRSVFQAAERLHRGVSLIVRAPRPAHLPLNQDKLASWHPTLGTVLSFALSLSGTTFLLLQQRPTCHQQCKIKLTSSLFALRNARSCMSESTDCSVSATFQVSLPLKASLSSAQWNIGV